MKKIILMLVAAMFLFSVCGVSYAAETAGMSNAPAATKAAKKKKAVKKKKKAVKKKKEAAPAESAPAGQ